MQTFRSQDMQGKAAELLDAAIPEPVTITCHDRPQHVLMSMQEHDRLEGHRRTVGAIEDLPESVVSKITQIDDTDDEH